MSGTVEFHPPSGFLEVASTLERHGHEAWAVGGAIRDAHLGHDRADWDLATDARPETVRRRFRRTVPIGIEHGTVGVLASDGVLYEVTTFRRDIRTDGRHAVVEFSDAIEDDLARRDFTINAVAWRPGTGTLVDPYGGREDLRAGILRAVGRPARRFEEDHLRVLRGLRFAGRYRMEIERETERALREAVPLTRELSAERVREELRKVLEDPRPSEALRLYAGVGLLRIWYPGLEEAVTGARGELLLGWIDALPRSRPALRLAAWLSPLVGEGKEGVEPVRRLMRRLTFSNALTERVSTNLRQLESLPSPVDSDAELRSWLAAVGPERFRDLFRLHAARARASGAQERARMLVFLWRRLHGLLLEHPPLSVRDLALDGHALLEMGVPEGPLVGLLLDELHARVLEEPGLNREEPLRRLAAELAEMGGLTGRPANGFGGPGGGSGAVPDGLPGGGAGQTPPGGRTGGNADHGSEGEG